MKTQYTTHERKTQTWVLKPGLILESYPKLQPLQFRYKIYTFQDTSRQSKLKEATKWVFSLSRPHQASKQVGLRVKAINMMLTRYSCFPRFSPAAEEQILLYHAFQNWSQSMWHEIRFVFLVYILNNHEDVQHNCFASSVNEIRIFAHESPMQTDCYLQSTTNPLNPCLEQFFRGNREHIPYFRTDYEWKFSENSPKNV